MVRRHWSLAIILSVVVTLTLTTCNKNKPFTSTGPEISLSANELLFFGMSGGSNPARQMVLVRNSGEGTLQFEISKQQEWLNLYVLPGTNADTIFCYVYSSGMMAGIYYDTITVSSSHALNSPQKIAVTLTVHPGALVYPPIIQVVALVDGPAPKSVNLSITSAGASGLTWSATKSEPWVVLSKPSGLTPDVITISLLNAGLLSGTYLDSIVITTSSPSTPRLVVPVILEVKSWVEFRIAGSNDLRAVHMIDDQTALVVGFIGNTTGHSGVILKTTDAGATWTAKKYFNYTSFGGIEFIDDLHGWAVGDSAVIMKTNDGGETWTQVPEVGLPVTDSIALWKVKFTDLANGWIVGTKGTLIRTVDSGKTWVMAFSPSPFSLADIEMVSSTEGWIIGNHGAILHTTDGANWTAQNSGSIKDLWGISMIDNLRGWVVGSGGEMLSTTDGGATWIHENSGVTGEIKDVVFLDQFTGWAVGGNGLVLRYQPGINNWVQQISNTPRTLFSAAFRLNGYGIAVGELGTIILTYNGGM
ncbi:MAG: hypothetical protein HY851_08525 [candidate division Zixibacteria bacterium]|nr:hypothetical protein [candidate division Zixibacteria bacterium]